MKKPPPVSELYKKASKNYLTPNTVLKGGEIWHARYVGRKLSIYFTWMLLHTKATPNMITGVSTFFGIIGSFVFSIPKIWALIVGFILFELYLILDSSDGEIARFTNKTSSLGNYIDTISHVVIYFSLYTAIGLNISSRTGESWPIYLGLLTSFVYTLAAMVHHLDPLLSKQSYLEFRSKEGPTMRKVNFIYNFITEDLNIMFLFVIFGILQYLSIIKVDIIALILIVNFLALFLGGVVFNLWRKFFDPRYLKI